jgi:large subunit ribosomal protein L4
MKVTVFNQLGKKASEISLNAAIFDVPANLSLVAQSIRVRLTNARTGTASTKNRREVSGGGRKPWAQKGTGRARQGSIRAPQWRGGGVIHGPRPRILHAVMPKQMRRKALFISLSDKLRSEQLFILDGLDLQQAKTSQLQEIVQALPVDRTVLFVVPEKVEAIDRSARNLPGIKVVNARVLHPYEILKYKSVVILQDSLPIIEQTFLDSTLALSDKSDNTKTTPKTKEKSKVAAIKKLTPKSKTKVAEKVQE